MIKFKKDKNSDALNKGNFDLMSIDIDFDVFIIDFGLSKDMKN